MSLERYELEQIVSDYSYQSDYSTELQVIDEKLTLLTLIHSQVIIILPIKHWIGAKRLNIVEVATNYLPLIYIDISST